MLSQPPVPAPVHIIGPSDSHSPVEVGDIDSDFNLDSLSPRLFGSSPSRRRRFSHSRHSVSSLSCSRSPLRNTTNIDHNFSRRQAERSWSKGSDGLRSGTTTVVPTRHSSPAPVPTPHNIHTKASRSLGPVFVRPRGRSGSQRKVNLAVSINRASQYPPRVTYPHGSVTPNFRRVCVEECRRWVTGCPPPAWPVVRATDASSRAHTVITKRLPEILEQAIKDTEYSLDCLVAEQSLLFLHNQHHLSIIALDSLEEVVQLEDKTKDLKRCIERMSVLVNELRSNSALQPIEDDGERDVQSWNKSLQRIIRSDGSCTFLNGPTLFVEAYVYRRLRGCFAMSAYWKDCDVFAERKHADFTQSADTVLELSQRFAEPFYAGDCVFPWEQLEKIREAFSEFLIACISGGPTDYESLLNMTESELQAAYNPLAPGTPPPMPLIEGSPMWESLSENYASGGSRIDFVLNNAGHELYRDLALADFMIQTGLASKVYFHGKAFPWFVSDVTRKDWDWLIRSLSDKHLFPYPTAAERTSLRRLGERWKQYEREGKFVYEDHPFWCTGLSFWDLPTHATDLFYHFTASSLVIFKGNLNYRRLTAGRDLPENMLFKTAIGPMATHPRAPPVCSLRVHQTGRGTRIRSGTVAT